MDPSAQRCEAPRLSEPCSRGSLARFVLIVFNPAIPSRDRLEARLRDKKDMYKDLEVSDALARELRRVPEEDLTIKV